jgi:hypothetical protein
MLEFNAPVFCGYGLRITIDEKTKPRPEKLLLGMRKLAEAAWEQSPYMSATCRRCRITIGLHVLDFSSDAFWGLEQVLAR